MTVGFVGDVHGDAAALRRALAALESADLVVLLGDFVGGSDDAAAVDLARSSGAVALQGNHDHWAAAIGRYALPAADREWLGSLPRVWETSEYLAYHSEVLASAWEPLEGSAPVRRAFRRQTARRIFCGHTHIPCVNVLREGELTYLGPSLLRSSPALDLDPASRYLVNCGEVGTCVVTWSSEAGREQVRYRFW